MFFTKLTEYSAYGAASAIFILFLQKEVMLNGESLGDSLGYQYYLVWGIVATIITMMVGAVCDTIGVRNASHWRCDAFDIKVFHAVDHRYHSCDSTRLFAPCFRLCHYRTGTQSGDQVVYDS